MVRFKNRWLLIEFIPFSNDGKTIYAPSGLNSKQIFTALRNSVQINFGDVGWGAVATSLNVKYFSPVTNMCIVRVARDHHRIAWGAITLVRQIQGCPVIPDVIHVSGTIKHAQLAAIEHNREVVARLRTQVRNTAVQLRSYDEYLDTSTKEIEALQD